MPTGFIVDENVPSQVLSLREAGYDASAVSDVARAGIRNEELAEISVRGERVLITRDIDFTRLERSLMRRVKVIYVRLRGDPDEIARSILERVEECTALLQGRNVVVLDEEGCYPLI